MSKYKLKQKNQNKRIEKKEWKQEIPPLNNNKTECKDIGINIKEIEISNSK